MQNAASSADETGSLSIQTTYPFVEKYEILSLHSKLF
jgi:hypothetical protein